MMMMSWLPSVAVDRYRLAGKAEKVRQGEAERQRDQTGEGASERDR